MARTPNTPRQPVALLEIAPGGAARHEAAQDAHSVALQQADAHVRAVARQLGYQLPADCTDPDLIQRDISANMRRSVEACLEVGRGLQVLKEACGHGNFIQRLDVLGLERNVAGRFMRAAVKFSSNAPLTAHLTQAIGNQTKLFEMLVLDDEQIEELQLTGQTGDLHLDDIATMSVKELRTALREARHLQQDGKAEREAKDQVIARLKTQLGNKKLQEPTPDEWLNVMLQEVGAIELTACSWIEGSLRKAIAGVLEYDDAHEGDHRAILSGYIQHIEDATDRLRQMFGLSRLEYLEGQGREDPFAPLTAEELARIEQAMPQPINVPPSLKSKQA